MLQIVLQNHKNNRFLLKDVKKRLLHNVLSSFYIYFENTKQPIRCRLREFIIKQ